MSHDTSGRKEKRTDIRINGLYMSNPTEMRLLYSWQILRYHAEYIDSGVLERVKVEYLGLLYSF